MDTMNQVSFMTKGMANTIAHNLTDIIVQDEMQDNAVNEAMNILNGIQ
jgi:chemotaxis protein CheY-P-specific phosphatase CheC